MADEITSALDFWEKLSKAKEAVVKFKKKDGTIRVMVCTLDFTQIPKKQHPKSVNIKKIVNLMRKNGIIHCFDLEKQEWRSIPFKQADWVELDKVRYRIRKPA
jgi:hypothetical protein